MKSAVAWDDLPPADAPEVAMVGRSNAGKSSALNTLAKRTRLAFVSKTPGRTQALNYYARPKGGYVVDLPGYGYAKAARATKMDWGPLLGRYVRERPTLRGIVMLMDIRHPLTELDHAFLEWILPTDRALLVLLTKSDKVSNQARAESVRDVQSRLNTQYPTLVSRVFVKHFSSLKRWNVQEVSAHIDAWYAADAFQREDT